MPGAAEAMGMGSGLQSALDAGLNAISENQTVVFTQYTKSVIGSDGFVFWVATSTTLTVSGSLHYATTRFQDEDQTIGANHVLLTSESEVTEFNLVSPTTMWVGSWPLPAGAPSLQIAFSQRGQYYQQSNLWHYSGFAVYPALKAQLVSSSANLPTGQIVSNSLPIWLAQTTYGTPSVTVPVYPSFLVPDNAAPPYVVAHIEPGKTEAIGAFPVVGPWPGDTVPNSGASPLNNLQSWNESRDEVTLTLYGFTNTTATQYLQMLIDGSENGSIPFGFANSPSIQDEKRTQVEIAALAQKKRIHISANYYMGAADAIARRLILSAGTPTITVAPIK